MKLPVWSYPVTFLLFGVLFGCLAQEWLFPGWEWNWIFALAGCWVGAALWLRIEYADVW